MSDTVSRFSNRVENYVKYRPDYPPGVLDLFRTEMGLTQQSVIADVGSGPGISARMFLENGNVVYCVEPNDAMRAAAEDLLSGYAGFRSINGTAEATALADRSVDIVTAAQAFHWFDPEPTKLEFRRILVPGGFVALIWNERQLDTTPFLVEYEEFLVKHANDYASVRHDKIKDAEITSFLGPEYGKAVFENIQVFDLGGLKGRMFSASYMPAEDSEQGRAAAADLERLFAKHADGGKIKVFYDTNIFYSKW